MTRTIFIAALLALAGCFDLNGPSRGGQGEPCWTAPEDDPCEPGLHCRDGLCRGANATEDDAPAKLIPCIQSLDCLLEQACIDGYCGAYTNACDQDAGCRSDFFCAQERVCRKRASTASGCSSDSECLSGHCADGVCCDVACTGTCLSCTALKSGGLDGLCSPNPVGTDPDSECFGALACAGTGKCDYRANGDACSSGQECESGACVDGVCCSSACSGECEKCSAAGICTTILNAEDPGVCDDSHAVGGCNVAPCTCDSSGTCKSGGGVACTSSANCTDGAPCVDGVCCNTICNGPCEACVSSKTGAATGICSPIPDGGDPDNECTGGATCNGSRACYSVPNGEPCGWDRQCISGICAHSPNQTTRVNRVVQLSSGICCNSRCDDLCDTCYGDTNLRDDPTRGVCHPIVRHRDPFMECGETACGGAAWHQCTFPSSHMCGTNEACHSDACTILCIPVNGGAAVSCRCE